MAATRARQIGGEDDRLTALDHAVFGFPGDSSTGLIHRIIRIEQKVDDLRQAMLIAALSFATGSTGVAVAIVLS